LITRSKGKKFFVAPGGKLEPGESIEDALKRELKEEVEIDVSSDDVEAFGTFYALAAGHEDKYLRMDVYMVHRWKGEIIPSHEIEEIRWINSTLPTDIELGSIFHHDVLPKLKERGLID
jgi:mutator protein MutT